MAFFESIMGGSSGGSFRIRMHLDLVGQEVGNNRSLVRYTAYLDRTSTAGGRIWNLFNNTYGTSNKNGATQSRGPYSYDTTGTGRVITFSGGEDFWVNHDGAGNAGVYGRIDYNPDNSPYFTSGWVDGSMGLPTINRYAAITVLNASSVTDVSFVINVNTDVTCNFLQISLEDGVGWRDVYGSNFTGYSVTVGPGGLLNTQLPSNKLYNFRARVRRADSGLWSESGVASVTTGSQGSMFDSM